MDDVGGMYVECNYVGMFCGIHSVCGIFDSFETRIPADAQITRRPIVCQGQR